MTLANKLVNRFIPPGSRRDTIIRYIRYGLAVIRQEGLSFFSRRIYRFLTWQLTSISQTIAIKLKPANELRSIKVNDVAPDPLPLPHLIQDIFPICPVQEDQDRSTTAVKQADQHDRLVKIGIACHNEQVGERKKIIAQGSERYSNRRVLFLSPIKVLGGGANLIILAANAMQRMGVEAQILNLDIHRAWFERNYPNLNVPVKFTEVDELPSGAKGFDAVVATSNPTISWCASIVKEYPNLITGYYIQDYEPYFYPPNGHEYQRAHESYTLLPRMIRMVTTSWISELIWRHHHVDSTIVGAHMDTDLFRPRPRVEPSWPKRPLHITAMIRPSTPRRSPKITMALLQQASKMYQSRVEIILFGCSPTEPGFASLNRDFPWKIAGQLRPTQMAHLLNEADIFVDYSEFQAFGLTALESMASALAVIVPAEGGAHVYAKHEENCLVVDTHDQQASFSALQRLIEDETLRTHLQHNAINTAARFFPELPALNMLKALFPED